MRNRIRLLISLCVAALAATAMSCATTKTDVDATPTARMKVDAHVGKGWNSDSTKIENISSSFRPEDVIYAVVDVSGGDSGTLIGRWSNASGNVVLEQTSTIVAGQRNYPFKLIGVPLTAGDYKFEAWLNGKMEDAEHFKVES